MTWFRDGAHLMCMLPSGHPLVYRNARIERRVDGTGREKCSITYDHGSRRASTHGAKLTENVVQAICRDLLAAALVRLERAGSNVVLHIQDEIIAELLHASEHPEFAAMMCEVLDWAGGLPLETESHAVHRYRK